MGDVRASYIRLFWHLNCKGSLSMLNVSLNEINQRKRLIGPDSEEPLLGYLQSTRDQESLEESQGRQG